MDKKNKEEELIIIEDEKGKELVPHSSTNSLVPIASRALVEAKKILKKIVLISGKVACSSPSPKTHKGEFRNNVEGKPLCFYYFECERCQKPFFEYRHEWTDFITLGDQCKVYRTCKHCGIEEYGDTHFFSKFGVSFDCKMIGTCEKCGSEREFGKAHRWSITTWKDSEGKTCEKKTCVQCGKEA